jgi:hypothetical protein
MDRKADDFPFSELLADELATPLLQVVAGVLPKQASQGAPSALAGSQKPAPSLLQVRTANFRQCGIHHHCENVFTRFTRIAKEHCITPKANPPA